jgi:hypothetical protein
VTVTVRRIVNDIPTTWATTMCVGITCWQPEVSQCNFSTLAPGQKDSFLLHFLPDTLRDTGRVVIVFLDQTDTTSSYTQVFRFRTNSPTQLANVKTMGTFYKGRTDTIRWTTDLTGMGALDISTNSGEDWTLIDSMVDLSAHQYLWVPTIKTNIAKLRLRTSEGNSISDMFRIQVPTGVSESSVPVSSVMVAPNPASTYLGLESQHALMDKVEIFDISGRQVLTANLGTTSAKLNIHDLPAGYYRLRIGTSEGIQSSALRVVK